jgi:hypothetical protein
MHPKPGQWSQTDPHICPDKWREYVAAVCRRTDTQIHAHSAQQIATRVRETLHCAHQLEAVWWDGAAMADLIEALRCAFDAAEVAWLRSKDQEIAAARFVDALMQDEGEEPEPPCSN